LVDYASVLNKLASSDVIPDEDIETLFGKSAEERFVADCFNHGAQVVFITRGPDGASGYLPDGSTVRRAGVAVDVVDTVGAGDTFQAAMLHWMAAENHIGDGVTLNGTIDLDACMEFAINAAAITCTRKGADLPYLSELAPS